MNKYFFWLWILCGIVNKSYATDLIIKETYCCCPIEAQFYGSVKAGLSGGFDIECEMVATDLGYYLGAAFGYRFAHPLWWTQFSIPVKLEGEILYQRAAFRSDISQIKLEHVKGSLDVWSYMTNVIFDFNCDFPVRPYLGVGVGYAMGHGDWSGTLTKDTGALLLKRRIHQTLHESGLAGQVIAGLKYSICEDWEVNLDYRFFRLSNKMNNHKLGLILMHLF